LARVRLHEARPEGEAAYYARTYPQGYRHDVWPDHVERVAASVAMIRRYAGNIRTAADLSCGDAAILRGCADMLDGVTLGDVNGVPWAVREDGAWSRALEAKGLWGLAAGALPESLDRLGQGMVDLFVLSETLEHMDDPDLLLGLITRRARYLFLSTPLAETPETGNPEHYWSWDQADIHEMFLNTGWTPLQLEVLKPVSTVSLPNAYTYQLWMAVSR
jgi:hypothetical protein